MQSTTETTGTTPATKPAARQTVEDRLIDLIAPIIAPLGYEIVYLEALLAREKIMRLFIDWIDSSKGGIGIEDCAIVSRTLNEPLDQMPEIDQIFKGTYELEVSSPGVERPLRREKDFVRYAGERIRLHTFRPLTAAEIENETYQKKNPKQKNFLGILQGMAEDNKIAKIVLTPSDQPSAAQERVLIPFALISKAHLEPEFDFSKVSEKGAIEL